MFVCVCGCGGNGFGVCVCDGGGRRNGNPHNENSNITQTCPKYESYQLAYDGKFKELNKESTIKIYRFLVNNLRKSFFGPSLITANTQKIRNKKIEIMQYL